MIRFIFKHFSLIMSIILAFVILGWAKSCSSYEKELEKTKGYIKDYETTISGKTGELRELQMTLDQFLDSRDSVIQKLRDSLKVKPKTVESVRYIKTNLTFHDTIKSVDSVFIVNKDYDSTIFYNPWTSLKLNFNDSCNCIVFTPEISNELYVVSSYKKEIIGKPNRFPPFRLFQKKRKVINVDITNSNDLIKVEQTRFINIIK